MLTSYLKAVRHILFAFGRSKSPGFLKTHCMTSLESTKDIGKHLFLDHLSEAQPVSKL